MERLKKFKQHYEKYKEAYKAVAVGSAVMTGVALFVKHEEDIQPPQAITPRPRPPRVPRPRTAGKWDTPYVRTTSVEIRALGDPGNIIQDVTTGTIYASQNQAARELGVSKTAVFNHLHGKTSRVAGHRLTVIGKAPPPSKS